MPECRNCGGFVTRQYARVFAPEWVEEANEVRVCPDCRDKIRDGADVRESRSPRVGDGETTRYDPDYGEED